MKIFTLSGSSSQEFGLGFVSGSTGSVIHDILVYVGGSDWVVTGPWTSDTLRCGWVVSESDRDRDRCTRGSTGVILGFQ